jgi:hypothetical protein
MELERNKSPGKWKMKLSGSKTAVLKLRAIACFGAFAFLLPWYSSALFAETGHGSTASAPATPASAQQSPPAAEHGASQATPLPAAESSSIKHGKNCGNRYCYRRVLAPDLSFPMPDGANPIVPCNPNSPSKWRYSDHRYSLVMVVASWNLASEILISILEPEIAELSRRSIGIFAVASHDTMSALRGLAPEPIKGADAEFYEPEPGSNSAKKSQYEERRRNWCLLNRDNMHVGIAPAALESVRSPSAQKFAKVSSDAAILRTVWGKNPKVPTIWLVDSRGQVLDEIALPTREQFSDSIARLKLWTDF